MKVKVTLVIAVLAATLYLASASSHAFTSSATLQVPEDYATIQLAVNAAAAGDTVRVGPGSWCGATIDKQLNVIGEGNPTITGCAESPTLFGVLRIGFFLPVTGASGTTIRHFKFDGSGVSNSNLVPLAFAIFARNANNVIIEQNTVLGTVQAITNTEGSGWTVGHNTIDGLTVFACDGQFCGGGDAIVFQSRSPASTAHDNEASFNTITETIPANFTEFDMTGIFLIHQDGAVIKNNKIGLTPSTAPGEAILVSDLCCGDTTLLGFSLNSVIVNNDGRGSFYSVVITPGNLAGTTLRGNFGLNSIDGSVVNVTNRSISTVY